MESHVNENGTAAFAEKNGIGVFVTEINARTSTLEPARKVTRVKDDELDQPFFDPVSNDVAAWGEDNIFPQTVLDFVKENSSLSPLLNFKVRAMSSATLQYGSYEVNPDTNERVFKQAYIPEIEEWLKCNMIKYDYLPKSFKDIIYLGNISPEIILTRDRSKAALIARQDVSFFRKKIQEDRSRMVEHGWLYANWDGIAGLSTTEAIEVNVFEPQQDEVNVLKDNKRFFKFIYPCNYPTLGELYYAMASWHPIINSGWLELLNEIPKIKLKYFENSMKLKYHIEIDYRYWAYSIPEWESMTQEQQIDVKKEKMDELAKTFADTEGAGKAVTTDIILDQQSRTQMSLIKVHELKNTVEDGILNEDSQEASSHLCAALGIDNTLVTTPGKSIGAGSGSDKRLAWNILMKLMQMEQDIVLKPLNFCLEYNGHKGIEFRLVNPLMATLNEVSPAQRQMPNE